MSAIPYSTRPRMDTGLTNARFGTLLFLLTEIMFYGGLISAYVFLRSAAVEWPAAGKPAPVGMGAIAFALHTGAALAVIAAGRKLRKNSRAPVSAYAFVTTVLATGFIATVGVEHLNIGSKPADSTYHAVYFLITNTHRIHVGAGALCAAYMLGPGRALQMRDSIAFANRVTCIAWYWLFLGLSWTVVAALFYVV
jgi:cytochrome c oxidase subunit III